MAADRDDGFELPASGRPGPDQRAADQPAEGRPADAAASTPELRERQLAEHARYRLVVEATAGRARWARAAPELRAEWAEHKQRHPAPDRPAASTHPDGSWHGDGGRRLSPEANAEADKCAADLRDEAERSIRPAMERVAAADPERKLAGLEHMLKGEDRLKEKVADEVTAGPGQDVRAALSKISDAVRFTLVYSSERYAEGVTCDVDRLKAEGFELTKLKNLWHSDQYKGINSQWRVPASGTRFEMQFHTAESCDVKELTHAAYERLRSMAVLPEHERDPVAEQELGDFQRRANTSLATPPGADFISDFPRKKEQSGG